ncbi:OmpA/MotB family protein [Clostridium aminobutyricum]|uniref:OmpA family protein n=1 Tax=Clostridium aminobutyricum TaxID=33953 RepID=A0A939IIL2_CLOAM|nr:flagellar motor protein MotB [Clostridium aminobutyricum]MBN7772604.1 OmpA family protein [Clostridium aminobutyricum]
MSKKKKHKPHEEEGGEAWLLPYSDLMTLLLAVFIVLFAVSQVDQAKAQQMSEEFTEQMMSKSSAMSSFPNTEVTQGTTSVTSVSDAAIQSFMGEEELESLEKLKAQIDAKIESEGMTSSVKTKIDMRGLVISFNNAILFDPGSARIKPEKKDALIAVASMMTTINHYIRIEGHTDNVPMSSEQYPSNWELSTARATSVVKLFVDKCNFSPGKLMAVGYGEYRPIADNSTAEGKSKNRRIDIIVLSDKYNNLENQVVSQ